MSITLQRTEILEQLFHVLFLNTAPRVFHTDVQSAAAIVLVWYTAVTIHFFVKLCVFHGPCLDLDAAILCELTSIAKQVHADLLDTLFVSHYQFFGRVNGNIDVLAGGLHLDHSNHVGN